MNKDKTIKDLKERNYKLANQSRQHEMREHHYLYKCEQLEKEKESLQKRIDKAIEYYKEQCDDIVDYNEAIIVKILKGEEK